MAERFPVPLFCIVQRRQMLARNDNYMRRRLWRNVVKRYGYIILIDALRGDAPISDLAKNTVVHAHIQIKPLNHRRAELLIRCPTRVSAIRPRPPYLPLPSQYRRQEN